MYKDKGVGRRAAAGGSLTCGPCWAREFAPKEKCAGCSRSRPVHKRVEKSPFCNTCYKREILLAVCGFCRVKRRLHARDPVHQRPTCLPCWEERFAKPEKCLLCDDLAVVRARGPEGEPICHRCWSAELRPREPCVKCGNERVACERTPEGRAICPQCWFDQRPAAKCPYCKEVRKLMRREDGDWICKRCYPKFLAPKHRCADCHAIASVHFWRSDTEPLCSTCYQRTEQPQEACAKCGAVDRVAERLPHGGGHCRRCYERQHRVAS